MSALARSLRAALVAAEEQFLMPTLRSRHPERWVAGRDLLTAPLQLRGRLRRHTGLRDGRPVRIACVGREKRFGGLLRRWFASPPAESADATRSLWSPRQLERLDADLVAVEVHRWAAPAFRRAGWLIVPEMIRWQGVADQVPPPRQSDSLKSDLVRVRRGGFTLEVTRAPEAWTEFFETMALPQARTRFGPTAWVPSPPFRSRLAQEGVLLFVRRGDAGAADGRLAGFAAIPLGRTIWFPVSGLRGGDTSLLRDGVMAAMYALAFDWARAEGYERIDLGRTTAFCRDGVVQVKRKWGFTPVRDPLTHLTALRLNPACAPLRLALAAEPLIIETEDGLAELSQMPAGR